MPCTLFLDRVTLMGSFDIEDAEGELGSDLRKMVKDLVIL